MIQKASFRDGGDRIYRRVEVLGRTYLVMRYSKGGSGMKTFLEVQKELAEKGFSVPKIFKTGDRSLLIEDLGSFSLEKQFQEEGFERSFKFYQKSVDDLARLQKAFDPPPPSLPVFDERFFEEETELSIQRLEFFSTSKKTLQTESFLKEMKSVIRHLGRLEKTYCHRDFHSRNLMISNGRVFMLDFQDRGIGPYVYDLTSLIFDSYVSISKANKYKIALYYLKKTGGDIENLKLDMRLQFLQRGFKACGCFAGFFKNDKRATHLKFIEPTLRQLEEAATGLKKPELKMYFFEFKKEFEVFQMKACLFAAGLGSRLRPLTHFRPKTCVPFLNLPILFYNWYALECLGAKNFLYQYSSFSR